VKHFKEYIEDMIDEGRADPKRYKQIMKILKNGKSASITLSRGEWCSVDDVEQLDKNADTFFCTDEDGEEIETSYDDIGNIEIV